MVLTYTTKCFCRLLKVSSEDEELLCYRVKFNVKLPFLCGKIKMSGF